MDYFKEGERLRVRFGGLKRYPTNRNIIPFAHREDNDDVACWDKNSRHQVIIIHDFMMKVMNMSVSLIHFGLAQNGLAATLSNTMSKY